MKKFSKFLLTILALIGLFTGGFRIANADVTTNFWVKQSDGIYTNEGNGLGLGAIHIGACYIGPGTGTPCTSAGAIGIGSPITGGVPNSVLTVSGSGNLSQTTPSVANTHLVWNGSAFVWSASATPISLRTNGVANTSQSILNLIAGTNVTLSSDGSGGVTINSTGGGGGSPSLPLDGVQYNTANAFDADSLFLRNAVTNYTDILKSFSILVPSSVTGTMSPLPGTFGNFTGSPAAVYTLTIVGDNVVTLDYNSLVGGTLNVGDTITGITTGATGTLLSFTGTTALVNTTAGDFTGEIALSDTTSGASALVSLVTAENDAFDYTDGTITVNGVLIDNNQPQSLNNGAIVGFQALTGYVLGATATWSYTPDSYQGGFKITPDGTNNAFGFPVPGSFSLSDSSTLNLHAINGTGDISAIIGVPTGVLPHASINAVYNPVAGDGVFQKNYYYDGSIGGTAAFKHETDVSNGNFTTSFVADSRGFGASTDDISLQQTSFLSLQNQVSQAQIGINDNATNFQTGLFSGLTGSQIYVRPVFTGTKDWALSMVDITGADRVNLTFGNITDGDTYLEVSPGFAKYMLGDENFSVGGTYLEMTDNLQLTDLWTTNLHVQSQNPLNAPLIYIDSTVRHTRLGYNAGGNSSLLAGGENVYVGYEAGFGATGSLGQANTAVGYRAGYSIDTVGDENTLIGWMVGDDITTGQNNTLIGARAGDVLTTQSDNVLVGAITGSVLTGAQNAFFGTFSGSTSTTADQNVFLGHGAGIDNNTGDNNVCIGYLACDNNVSGGSNIIIGSESGMSTSRSSSIGIGRNVSITTDNQLVIGSGAHPNLSGLIGDHTDANNGIAFTYDNTAKTVEMGHLFGAGNNTKIRLNDTTGQQFVILDGTNLVQLNSNRILLNGSQQIKRTAVADADYVIPPGDYLVSMESLSAPRTVTVPDASTSFAGRTYIVKDADCLAGTHNITLDPAGTDTIDNATTLVMSTNCESITFSSDGGTNWEVL